MRRQGRQSVRVQDESRHNCIARQQLQKITSWRGEAVRYTEQMRGNYFCFVVP
jgi:hypothetical protein